MPRVIVCDVNDTLLDIGALEPAFRAAFGDGRVVQDRPALKTSTDWHNTRLACGLSTNAGAVSCT